MKPLLRSSQTKITKLYFTPINEEDGAEDFRVTVITDDGKESPALYGTMCVGFFLKLVSQAIKHRAKIYERKFPKQEFKNRIIYNPKIKYFKQRFTWNEEDYK